MIELKTGRLPGGMNRVIGKALGPDLRLVARPLCRIDHQRETNPEDARPGLLEPEGADLVVKLLAGHVVAGPEKAHPAIQHPHVIEHALRQLGVQHPRPKLETRVRTFCIVDAEHMPEPQEEPRRHTQDSPGQPGATQYPVEAHAPTAIHDQSEPCS